MKEEPEEEERVLDVRELLQKVYDLHGSALVLIKILANGRLQLMAVASNTENLDTILTTKDQQRLNSYVG